MGSSSVSQALNPISDIKPTLNDSPTQVFSNRTDSLVDSNKQESTYGDTAWGSNMSRSMYGDSLTNSSVSNYNNATNYMTLGQGASITDGGAIGAMFQLTKQVLESQQKNIVDTVTEAKKEAESQTTTTTELKDKFLEFYQNNKAAVILAAAAAGWFIFKGVKA